MGEGGEMNLLLETVEDITEDWVIRLLNSREDHSGPRPLIQVRKWSRHECPSKDNLAGFSSSRATVKIEYEVTNKGQETQMVQETLVIKVVPTQGSMAEMLTQEGMHHIEVGQYGHFLKCLQEWERQRRGVNDNCRNIMDELLPPHAMAASTESHFTIVLSDLRFYGYKTVDIQTGLNEHQLLTAAEKLGSFHGTTVAFKNITGTDLQTAFPRCFNVAETNNMCFAKFASPCFEQFKKSWSGDPGKTDLLRKLQTYEDILIPFVVNSLRPEEPFATSMHGDLQASNMFFKEKTNGELSLKLIDWATARYTQGPFDLAYLLNISVDTDIRRKASSQAAELYFEAFNRALKELGANLSYPRSTFESQLTLGMQLIVIWSIMSGNIFYSTSKLKDRLDAIVIDVLSNNDIKPPKV